MIFGWDISTSVIGITVLDNDGNFVKSSYIDLRKVDGGIFEKATVAESQLHKFFYENVDGDSVHYIEDRLGNFSAGKSMLQVLMMLAAFNAVISYMLKKLPGCEIHHIHPSSVKAVMKVEGLVIPKGADKKALTLAFVQRKEPSFPVPLNRNDKPQPYCYDMADSYIVAKAGFIKSYEARAQAETPPVRTPRGRAKEGGRVRLPLPEVQTP